MFIDQAKITVKAGNGGNGMVSFRREKYVPKGGPDGGNGGRGGSIYFVATSNISTLTDFRFGLKIKANNGGHGATKNQYGKSGEDLYVKVPIGTVVYIEPSREVLADFKSEGETILIAKGGKGGRGNNAFKSSINRTPRIAEHGIPGEEHLLTLELKLLADIGFIGLPNAGKSTLLSVISEARPLIDNYPFTTLQPELGVVIGKSGNPFVACDLPGIIKDAHLGKGLGLRFLRHAQRCKVLMFMIDGENSQDYYDQYKLLRNEVKKYGYKLDERPFFVAVSKDESDESKRKVAALTKKLKDVTVLGFSSLLHANIDKLIDTMEEYIANAPEIEMVDEAGVAVKYREYDLTVITEPDLFTIEKVKSGVYRIVGEKVEERYHKYILNTEEAILSLLNYLREIGVEQALEAIGINDGDTVLLCDFEFEYYR
ncbi:MAG: GTPase ObgE [Tenericutes bacterium ADurb.Bin239]|nr:MAG: GTPase ObgE [Tenericutes bacterium ADurb.Bin239]